MEPGAAQGSQEPAVESEEAELIEEKVHFLSLTASCRSRL
jgi:hypothetical protein